MDKCAFGCCARVKRLYLHIKRPVVVVVDDDVDVVAVVVLSSLT